MSSIGWIDDHSGQHGDRCTAMTTVIKPHIHLHRKGGTVNEKEDT
jgi:hypothetical protein